MRDGVADPRMDRRFKCSAVLRADNQQVGPHSSAAEETVAAI
ncbi:hypothetical protein [Streptomyces eurythermus]